MFLGTTVSQLLTDGHAEPKGAPPTRSVAPLAKSWNVPAPANIVKGRPVCTVMARAASDAPALGVHLLMGEQAPVMLKNVMVAIESGTLEPVELVASAG